VGGPPPEPPAGAAARGFRSVVLDCDSTLVAIEGIDWLAGPHAGEVRRMTDAAMEGLIPLEEVYGRRLALIHPTAARMEALSRAYVEALVPDARETVAALLWLGKTVRVISGGLRPAVEAVALALDLPAAAVDAVGIRFDGAGGYAGFEHDHPLARSGGKPRVIEGWALPRPALLVGDGMTDLEARPAVDCFAAYMGVAFRPAVAAGAEVVLPDPSLAPVLALAASPDERERLRASAWAALLLHGERLLLASTGGAGPRQ
jgi:phosphoserine phosphatase